MTGCTCDSSAITVIEREGVLEGGRLPGCGGVTGSAVGSILAGVSILGLMAGITIFGCAHEHAVDVAFSTGGIDVRASQREGGQVVIEGGRLPGRGGVTCRAVRSILAAVMIVGRMAGITSCGRAFEF